MLNQGSYILNEDCGWLRSVEAKKLQHDRPQAPNQRKRQHQHKSATPMFHFWGNLLYVYIPIYLYRYRYRYQYLYVLIHQYLYLYQYLRIYIYIYIYIDVTSIFLYLDFCGKSKSWGGRQVAPESSASTSACGLRTSECPWVCLQKSRCMRIYIHIFIKNMYIYVDIDIDILVYRHTIC